MPRCGEARGARGFMKHVAVLMGGWSAERPVSLNSGRGCADALEGAGYRVTRIDVARDIDVGLQLGEHVGDVAGDVDPRDAIACAFERVRATAPRIERDRPLRRPAPHKHRDMFHETP